MDNLFKALLIIILVAFLYLYYESSNNGRYIKYSADSNDTIINILDTKTGNLYLYYEDKITLYDLPNATIKKRDVKEQ